MDVRRMARAISHRASVARRLATMASEIQTEIRLESETEVIRILLAGRDHLSRSLLTANDRIRNLLGTGPDCGLGIDRDCVCPDCAGILSPFPTN